MPCGDYFQPPQALHDKLCSLHIARPFSLAAFVAIECLPELTVVGSSAYLFNRQVSALLALTCSSGVEIIATLNHAQHYPG